MQRFFKDDIPVNVVVKGNVIIAFKSEDECERVRAYLHRGGYGVYVCTTFEEIMEVEHVNVRCIVVDVTLGNTSTFHAIEIVKQIPAGKDIPILAVADVSSTSNVVRALNAGASDYILQPYTGMEFLQRVHSLAGCI